MAVELYDEHEQGERVRNWIKEYGAAIIMGLVLAFAGIFGFRFWQEQQSVKQARAADYFVMIQTELETGNVDAAQEAFTTLSDEASSSSYVGLAAMMLAGGYVEDGRLEPASRLYRDVLSRRDLDMLWPVATLRLARVLDAQGERADALAVLGTEPTTGFEPAWHELRGDLLFAEGQLSEARLAYQDALDALGGQVGGQRMLQMKLDATGQADDGETS
jgi:predicted negative regulator of RcsB-dependent stress response